MQPSVTTKPSNKNDVLLGTLLNMLMSLDSDELPITATLYTSNQRVISISVNTTTDDISDTELGTVIAQAHVALESNTNVAGALQDLLSVIVQRNV